MDGPTSSLRGSCACGRNRYVIDIPQSSSQLAQLLFDNSSLSRKLICLSLLTDHHLKKTKQIGWHQASPITAWLRIPLSWYHSTTYAFFPDETHGSIRKTFTSPLAATQAQRNFCGYCGTQLSSWHERTRNDADLISVTLGSLLDEDLGLLHDLGLVPRESDDDDDDDENEKNEKNENGVVRDGTSRSGGRVGVPRTARTEVVRRGAPWFEELVEDSRLGRLRRRRGGHSIGDGLATVEWEVTEWSGGGEGVGSESVGGKRKIADVEAETEAKTGGLGGDATMGGA